MNTQIEKSLRNEARFLSYYLIKQTPKEQQVLLYLKANRELQLIPGTDNALDKRIIDLVLKHPWMTGFFDGGFALLNPDSLVRRKIVTMSAILEASPWSHSNFLPVRFRKAHLFALVPRVFIAGIKSAVGLCAIKSYKVLWR